MVLTQLPLWVYSIMVIIIITFVIWTWRFMKDVSKWVIGLRVVVLLGLLLFVMQPSYNHTTKETMTLFVVDLSDSTLPYQDAFVTFIQAALKNQGPLDQAGIVVFGREPKMQSAIRYDLAFEGFNTQLESDFTNLSEALTYSMGLMPQNVQKRLVLLTDGYENMQQAESIWRQLDTKGIGLLVYDIQSFDLQEVQLVDVVLPEKVSPGQVMDVSVSIYSTIKTAATLQIYIGGTLSQSQEVVLDSGINRFVWSEQVSGEGLLTYQVHVLPEKDTYTQNNRLDGFTLVGDRPQILMITGSAVNGEGIKSMLQDRFSIHMVSENSVMESVEQMVLYDGFILVDVSAEHLSDVFMSRLEQLVRYQGKGVIAIGGLSSFGPGGYSETPLEMLLPVTMDVKSKDAIPNLGMVMVIDRSGSMSANPYGISRLELAKEAAMRGVNYLDAVDQLGVIAFDHEPYWVFERVNVTDPEGLKEQIGSIALGGGTTILPSLEMAVESLTQADTKLKHIILLTDGQAEQDGYARVLQTMIDAGITLSTVAISRQADTVLMKRLAEAGQGRYYFADAFTNLPTIFAKETFMAGEKNIRQALFMPIYRTYSTMMHGVDDLKPLEGYVRTTIKQNAQVILASDQDEPVLAAWQYGLGRSVAYTSDFDGLWSRHLLATPLAGQLVRQMADWAIQPGQNLDYTLEGRFFEGSGTITLVSQILATTEVTTIGGRLVDPSGEVQDFNLSGVRPGVYEGSFEPKGPGVYLFEGRVVNEDNEVAFTQPVRIGYTPEYDFYHGRALTPSHMAYMGSGEVISDPDWVMNSPLKQPKDVYDLSLLVLFISFVAFLLEIILRKTGLLEKPIKSRVLVEMPDPVAYNESQNKASLQEPNYTKDLLKKKKDRQS